MYNNFESLWCIFSKEFIKKVWYSIYKGELSWHRNNDFSYVAIRIHIEAEEANSIKHHLASASAPEVWECFTK